MGKIGFSGLKDFDVRTIAGFSRLLEKNEFRLRKTKTELRKKGTVYSHSGYLVIAEVLDFLDHYEPPPYKRYPRMEKGVFMCDQGEMVLFQTSEGDGIFPVYKQDGIRRVDTTYNRDTDGIRRKMLSGSPVQDENGTLEGLVAVGGGMIGIADPTIHPLKYFIDSTIDEKTGAIIEMKLKQARTDKPLPVCDFTLLKVPTGRYVFSLSDHNEVCEIKKD